MALFKPYRTTNAKLSSVPIVEGQFIVCIDTGDMYVDTDGSTRVKVGGNGASASGNIPVNPTDTSGINIWIETD